MPSDLPEPDLDKTRLFAFQVWQYKQGESVALMIHLGDRLGLYQALAGAGPVSAAELAAATGLHDRWVLEWLRSQAAAHLLDSPDGDHFELSPEGRAVLADESDSLWFAAGAFQGGAAGPEVVDRLVEAFRTGIGLTYDDHGPSAAHTVERMLGPWSRLRLAPVILPALEGVEQRLRDGARVADVGCGAGVAALALAQAFPASQFEGYDPSAHAIARARAKLAETGLENLTFHLAEAAALPSSPTYDLILTLDCLHDMPHPTEAMASIRAAIHDDGTWLIKEIRSSPSWSENLRNPMLAMMYSTSVTSCMSCAMSEPEGEGLGTLGLFRERLEAMCRSAGFTRFAVHDFEDPANLYYEVRP